MKRIGLLLLAFLFLFSQCSVWAATDSGVRFADLFGEVSVRPDSEDDDAYEFAELETVLNNNDRIRTKSQSGAILSFADLSTFVMKEESVIVLDLANEKNSKINLIAGNIWVNVKKMVSDGSMDIEMSQAVAGIKGTNITCSTSRDEDRIQVLRGIAEVLIRETKEKVTVSEGEELVVKAGGKTEKVEIDVNSEQKKWDEATSRLGESIQMNEVPDVLKGILDSEASEFARINEAFQKLVALTSVEETSAAEIQKDAERFIGVIMEDNLILNSIRKKIVAAMETPDLIASNRVMLVSLMKEVAAVQAKQQAYQSQITKIMRYQFKIGAIIEDVGPEVQMLANEFAQTVSESDSVGSILAGNPSGMSQDWFLEAQEQVTQAIAALSELQAKVAALLEQNPTNAEALALSKQISDKLNSLATMLKSLSVVEIDSAKIIEMQETDDVLSNQMVTLQHEIDSYGSLTGTTTADKERRLKSSVQIMSSYARVRRLYVNAQRLYDSTMRSASTSKYKTSEMEELEMLWDRISNTFQQLGITAQELESNIKDLESQLSTYLK